MLSKFLIIYKRFIHNFNREEHTDELIVLVCHFLSYLSIMLIYILVALRLQNNLENTFRSRFKLVTLGHHSRFSILRLHKLKKSLITQKLQFHY